jgi:hypothetical protein
MPDASPEPTGLGETLVGQEGENPLRLGIPPTTLFATWLSLCSTWYHATIRGRRRDRSPTLSRMTRP